MKRLVLVLRWFISRLVHASITVLIVLAGSALLLNLYFAKLWHPQGISATSLSQLPSPTDRLRTNAGLETIEAAIVVYRLRTGGLPESLDVLVDAALLEPHAIYAPHSVNRYYYRTHDENFELLPPILTAEPANGSSLL